MIPQVRTTEIANKYGFKCFFLASFTGVLTRNLEELEETVLYQFWEQEIEPAGKGINSIHYLGRDPSYINQKLEEELLNVKSLF